MFLLDWLYSTLASLAKTLMSGTDLFRSGLYNKHAKILFLGLDNAGKTTLCYMLKESHLEVFTPTLHPHLTELQFGHIKITAYDLGGHETVRRLWREYGPQADAVVFIVDAMDRSRFPEAAKELQSLLQEADDIPFLVLGNKIDCPYAASEDELKYALGLMDTYGKNTDPSRRNDRPVELFMCSIARRMGYADGFQWLSKFLT